MYNRFSYIYDDLMKRQVDYELLASNLIKLCQQYQIDVKNVLECGMGSGNLTETLLKRGINVDGFDISDEMLSIAYNKLIDYKNVNILKGDIRTFISSKKYDLICCFFDVLNYIKTIDEIELFLKNAKKQMNENSILMFDINTEYKLKEYLGNNTFVSEEEDFFLCLEKLYQKKLYRF